MTRSKMTTARRGPVRERDDMRLALLACVAFALPASACSSSSTTSPAGTTTGDPASDKVIDCSPHSSLGSCGPSSNNCYCPGSTCFHPSTGVYTCGFACSSDADCDFTALGVRYGACVSGKCYPKSSGDAGSGGGGGGGGSGGGGG